jgi:hypothetical protein
VSATGVNAGVDLDNPFPNPPPLPTDLPAPRLVSPRGALRRSLVVWGWGQLAAGDRRGVLGPPLEVATLAGLTLIVPAASAGTNASLAFAAVVLTFAAWIAIAVHAHRAAAHRRSGLGIEPGPSGGIDLLWLAPLVVVFSTLFWLGAGRLGDPGTVLADYVADWQAGRADSALVRFTAPPGSSAELSDAWSRQLAGLRNALVRLAAVAGPSSAIDPERPLDTVRWTARPAESAPDTRLVDIEVVRQESVRGQLFGLLPSTTQRLVTLDRLGMAELRLVALPGPFAGSAWRIVRVDIGGIELDENS